MDLKLNNILRKGAAHIIVSDFEDTHRKVLGVITFANILGQERKFGRLYDAYDRKIAVGYLDTSKNFLERADLDGNGEKLRTVVFGGKAVLATVDDCFTCSINVWQGNFNQKSWKEIEDLPYSESDEIIKSFYQDDIIKDEMDVKFQAPRRKDNSSVVMPHLNKE